MQFVRPYTYFTYSPNGQRSFVPLTLLQFVPVVGTLVLLGYRAELADEFDDGPGEPRLPVFTLSRFGDFVTRGAAPFVYFLFQASVWFMAYVVTYFILLIGVVTMQRRGNDAFAALLLLSWAVTLVSFWYLTTLASWPFLLRAMLTREIAPGETFRFARDFYARVGWTMLFSAFPKVIFDGFLGAAGYLCCFVGLVPAGVVILLAEQHLLMQLYREYVKRGGERLERTGDGRNRIESTTPFAEGPSAGWTDPGNDAGRA